jgi:U3 small nucleolar ribonucleoprotein component
VEKNTSLEDMIRKRIKENNFDDVVQRVLREKALTPAAQIGARQQV